MGEEYSSTRGVNVKVSPREKVHQWVSLQSDKLGEPQYSLARSKIVVDKRTYWIRVPLG